MNITELVESHQGENYTLHRQHVNPVLPRVLQMIGYDIIYGKGEVCYLYDEDRQRYLDFLGGYGVFHLGRNDPGVGRVIGETLDLRTPNMVQIDCRPLSGLLAVTRTPQDRKEVCVPCSAWLRWLHALGSETTILHQPQRPENPTLHPAAPYVRRGTPERQQ